MLKFIFFDNDLTLNERVDSIFLKVISIYVWLSEKMSISSDLSDGSNTLLLTLIRLVENLVEMIIDKTLVIIYGV